MKKRILIIAGILILIIICIFAFSKKDNNLVIGVTTNADNEVTSIIVNSNSPVGLIITEQTKVDKESLNNIECGKNIDFKYSEKIIQTGDYQGKKINYYNATEINFN